MNFISSEKISLQLCVYVPTVQKKLTKRSGHKFKFENDSKKMTLRLLALVKPFLNFYTG